MKKLILLVVAMVMTFSAAEAFAATKNSKSVIEKQVFITNINCHECVKKIMNYMPNQKGVKDVEVNLNDKIVEVTYDSKKISTTTIIKYFKKIDIAAKVYTKPAKTTRNTPSATPTPTAARSITTNNSNKR